MVYIKLRLQEDSRGRFKNVACMLLKVDVVLYWLVMPLCFVLHCCMVMVGAACCCMYMHCFALLHGNGRCLYVHTVAARVVT